MKTSSPLERKIFRASPGSLAKPKNFNGIGGAAGTTGGFHPGPFGWSVAAEPAACGIFTDSACDTKIFRPDPAYTVPSLEASRSSRSVGSRLAGPRTFFATPPPRRGAVLGVAVGRGCDADTGVPPG